MKTKKPIIRSLDLIGKTINNLKILGVDHINSRYVYYMLCECKLCGKQKVIRVSHINSGSTRDCGCVKAELARQRKTMIEPLEYAKIVERYENGESCSSIGKDYGVTRQAIQWILAKIRKGEFKI